MVADEQLEPLDRVGGGAERLLGAGEHPHEAALLDQGEQLRLAAHVVIHPGERHPARRREVAHRGRVIAPFGEHRRRPGQQVLQPLVVGAYELERLFEFRSYSLARGTSRGWRLWRMVEVRTAR